MSAIERPRPSLPAAGLLWPTVAMLAALAILLGLGTWQWQRKTWKEELIGTIKARSSLAPIGIDAWLARTCKTVEQVGFARSCEYTTVRLSGTFDHANERHVYTAIAKQAAGGVGGQGYWIMTPFRVAGSDVVVAVNRGFVPEARKDRGTRAQGQLQGDVDVLGLIRSAEPRATFTGANAPAKNIWYLRAPGELFAGVGTVSTVDFYVELQSPAPTAGLPQPTAGRIDFPNRHLAYALTWWALGCALIGVFGAFVWSRVNA